MRVDKLMKGDNFILYMNDPEDVMIPLLNFFYNINEDTWTENENEATPLTFAECRDYIEQEKDSHIKMCDLDYLIDVLGPKNKRMRLLYNMI